MEKIQVNSIQTQVYPKGAQLDPYSIYYTQLT